MRILIFDGFGENPEGRRRYEEFENAIIDGLDQAGVKPATGLEVVIRGNRDVEDYLYEQGSKYVDEGWAKRFDTIDVGTYV